MPKGVYDRSEQQREKHRQHLQEQVEAKGAPLATTHGAHALQHHHVLRCNDTCPMKLDCLRVGEVGKGQPCPVIAGYIEERTSQILAMPHVELEDAGAARSLAVTEASIWLIEAYLSLAGYCLVVKGRTIQPQPVADHLLRLQSQALKLYRDFGLTPAGRQKLRQGAIDAPPPLSEVLDALVIFPGEPEVKGA